MFTPDTFIQTDRMRDNQVMGHTAQAERLQQFYREVYEKAVALGPEIRDTLQQVSSGIKIEDRGIIALARARIAAPSLYPEIKRRVLIEASDPAEPSILSPALVNRKWVEEEIKREKSIAQAAKRTYSLSPKLAVLSNLLDLGINEANPAITHEELRDLLVAERKSIDSEPYIPTYPGVVRQRYEEPPYLYLYAQMLMLRSPELTNRVLHVVVHDAKLLKEMEGKPFNKMNGLYDTLATELSRRLSANGPMFEPDVSKKN